MAFQNERHTNQSLADVIKKHKDYVAEMNKSRNGNVKKSLATIHTRHKEKQRSNFLEDGKPTFSQMKRLHKEYLASLQKKHTTKVANEASQEQQNDHNSETKQSTASLLLRTETTSSNNLSMSACTEHLMDIDNSFGTAVENCTNEASAKDDAQNSAKQMPCRQGEYIDLSDDSSNGDIPIPDLKENRRQMQLNRKKHQKELEENRNNQASPSLSESSHDEDEHCIPSLKHFRRKVRKRDKQKQTESRKRSIFDMYGDLSDDSSNGEIRIPDLKENRRQMQLNRKKHQKELEENRNNQDTSYIFHLSEDTSSDDEIRSSKRSKKNNGRESTDEDEEECIIRAMNPKRLMRKKRSKSLQITSPIANDYTTDDDEEECLLAGLNPLRLAHVSQTKARRMKQREVEKDVDESITLEEVRQCIEPFIRREENNVETPGHNEEEEIESDAGEHSRAFRHFINGYADGFKNRLSMKAKNRMDLLNIEEERVKPHCNKYCPNNCQLPAKTIQRFRNAYYSIKQGHKQIQYLIEKIRETQMLVKNHSYHFVEGKEVCRQYFVKVVLNIGESTYKRALALYHKDVYRVSDSGYNSLGSRGMDAKAFMQNFVDKQGDPSPSDNKVLIPSGVTVRDLYLQYVEEVEGTAPPIQDTCEKNIKESRFYKIWQDEIAPKISFCKVGKVVKCSICMAAKNMLEREVDEEVRTRIKQEHKQHLHKQRYQREYYYQIRHDAIARPTLTMSVIGDGMDQAKLDLPHYKAWNKPKNCTYQQDMNVTGVIVHGKQTHHYIDCLQYPHDSNLLLNCILHAISEHAPLPPVLHVQMDNCGRENKNCFVMAFMALMVKLGYLKEVYCNFLMTGHTHEDIDQKFSKISHRLKRKNCWTPMSLYNCIKKSLKKTPEVDMIGQIYDIKAWIDPYINRLKNISNAHHFWFYMDTPDHVNVKYKFWADAEEWLPEANKKKIEMFILDEDNQQIIPQGEPQILAPDFQRKVDLGKLSKSILSSKGTIGNIEWWCDWTTKTNTENMWNEMATHWEWPLKKLIPYAWRKPATEDARPIAANPLRSMRDKELGVNVKPIISEKRTATCSVQNSIAVSINKFALYRLFARDVVRVGKIKQKIKGGKVKLIQYQGKMNGIWKELPHKDPLRVSICGTTLIILTFEKLTTLGRLPKLIKDQIAKATKQNKK